MALSYNTSLKNVAAHYTQLLNLEITDTSIKKNIEENPHFPSLFSLTSVFDKYKIENGAFEIGPDSVSLLTPPFIAFASMPKVGNDFILVTKMNENEIDYIYKGSRTETVSKNVFLSTFRNVIWMAEPTKQVTEVNYVSKLKSERKISRNKKIMFAGSLMVVLLMISLNLNTDNLLRFSLITIIKILGTTVSVLLLIFELDNENSFITKICNVGGNSGCEIVLGSSASKIAGVSWSEVGFIYFSTTLLILILPNLSFDQKRLILGISNALAFPYILFSIYYQWKILKKWCALCLSIQLILLLEFTWSLIYFWRNPLNNSFSITSIISIIMVLLMPTVAWLILKPVFKKAQEFEQYRAAYKRLQYNGEIFESILRQQSPIASGWENLGIRMGSCNGKHHLVKVCNPFCGPCAKAHLEIEELINRRSDISVHIIFTTKNAASDPGFDIVRHLLAIAESGDKVHTKRGLDEWYSMARKDYAIFAAHHPIEIDLNYLNEKVEQMGSWTKNAEISATPTFFLNGFRLPENYKVEELSSIL